ncbi:hypothetical protein [Methylobacter sp. Wu1]|uniref:hypothetical protein n=1 Tax=Methylobacter sp. Wu1 TaxID=3119359 RepID=UPI002F955727
MSRTAMLKRKLYKAAIKGLITLAFMIPTYIWFIDRTTDVINKRIEKQQLTLINQKKQEAIARAIRETEIREAEQEKARFKAQYRKPEKCYNVQDNETRVDCANDYIRARKAFENAAN